jgi:hypothetical protein
VPDTKEVTDERRRDADPGDSVGVTPRDERASGDDHDPIMSTYMFICPECKQEIEVNGSMREAILSSGCPVCTETADQTDFE